MTWLPQDGCTFLSAAMGALRMMIFGVPARAAGHHARVRLPGRQASPSRLLCLRGVSGKHHLNPTFPLISPLSLAASETPAPPTPLSSEPVRRRLSGLRGVTRVVLPPLWPQ